MTWVKTSERRPPYGVAVMAAWKHGERAVVRFINRVLSHDYWRGPDWETRTDPDYWMEIPPLPEEP